MKHEWAKTKTNHWTPHSNTEEKRIMLMEFKSKSRRRILQEDTGKWEVLPLERMILATVYGYNSPVGSPTKKRQSHNMWKTVFQQIKKYKGKHPMATAIIAGDLNAAKDAHLDTNRVNPAQRREKDACILEAIEGQGMKNIFRCRHPKIRAWTREPTGDLQTKHVAA